MSKTKTITRCLTSFLLIITLIFSYTFNIRNVSASSADHFVIEVTITDAGDTTFTIPTFVGETYNYDVDWDNDEVFEDTANTGDATHDFTTTGTYVVRITGTFPRIYFNNTGDVEKITDIVQWGTNTWSSMAGAFHGAINLNISATDTPDLSLVTDMSNMFNNADSLNADIGSWDVSNVTDMSYLFYDADGLQDNVGTFESAIIYSDAPTGAQAIDSGDLNNDGYPDFIVNALGFKVYLNDGDGTFTVSALYDEKTLNIRSADLADMNGDGYLDYILPDFNSLVHIFYNNKDGTFGDAFTITGVGNNLGASAADLNNDSHIDIVTAHWSGSSVAVILNNGNGTFATPVEYSVAGIGPRKIAIADLNNDGHNDLAVTTDAAGSISVLLNNGDGTFADYVSYANSGWVYTSGVDVGDVNQDGNIDIAVAAHGACQYMGILLNNGDGTFSSGSNFSLNCEGANDIKLGDVNGDGYLDTIVAHSQGIVSVFLNNGSGSFASRSILYLGASSGDTNLSLDDFDQDGGLDIVVSSSGNARAVVFLNKSLGLNNWDTSSVIDMSYMFANTDTFNQNLSSWNVLYNADVTNMFSGAVAFNEDFDNWNILRPSSGPGALNIEINASCSVSDTNISIGEEIDIEINTEVTENGKDIPYTFRWIKELSGTDKKTSISFNTEGKYTPKAQIRTNYADRTISCDTITVSNNKNNTNNNTSSSPTPTPSSISDIVNKYRTLLTQLRALGITLSPEVETLLSQTSPTPSSSNNTYNFTRDLETGMEGEDVKLLQQFLNNNGYTLTTEGPGSPGNETTRFGALTRQALIRFQQANNITPAQGYFGSVTRGVVNSL
jgi:surface protein